MFILASASEICEDLSPIIKIVKIFLNVLSWTVPILLVVLGSFDMFKAVSTSDEKAAAEAKNKLIKRIVYGILVFLIPFFVNLIFELVDGIIPDSEETNETAWISCWKETSTSKNSYSGSSSIPTTKKEDTNTKKTETPTTKKECKYSCKEGGKLNMKNECYEHKLDSYSFDGGQADCNATCGIKAIKASYAKATGDGFTYCDCYYNVTKEC